MTVRRGHRADHSFSKGIILLVNVYIYKYEEIQLVARKTERRHEIIDRKEREKKF